MRCGYIYDVGVILRNVAFTDIFWIWHADSRVGIKKCGNLKCDMALAGDEAFSVERHGLLVVKTGWRPKIDLIFDVKFEITEKVRLRI